MKINRLDHTKSLFPHFYDKTDESNFTKHLKVVGEPQYDIRHKLKTIEWSRILEKPLQIWKEQTEPYAYDMHFKVIIPYLKQVNIYKNPIINSDEEIVSGELCHTESFDYENRVRLYEKVLPNLQSDSMIPKDTYVLEIFTWDDYHFLKGYPENDYTVMEDNVLEWRYNETFLSITLEEISYSKYLTFRVHKDRIRKITICKNEKPFITHEFDVERIGSTKSTDFSYTYFDDAITNEETYLVGNFDSYYELEDGDANNVKRYYVDTGKDEYVFRLPLTDEDFTDGIVKDIYDLEVVTFEKRYRCRHEYDKVYSKRYCGYDMQANDCFDHDYSLDMIGRLLNVHRFRFYQVYSEDVEHYSRTYPTFYDRATEDDYHYMKRIQFYISNYNHIVFPVLEFWKYYHTMATIKSRKRIVGEMDYAYLRTAYDDCIADYEYIDEEFESESVIEYSINKATVVEGTGSFISIDEHEWYESIVVKDVYVVPNVDYHLKYEVSDNVDDVLPRIICYNRQGSELRTMSVAVDSNKVNKVTDTIITIPSDTASVKLVLESNNAFGFSNAIFERMTVANFDNYYMGTDEDYNPNFYELYCTYEDLPSNLRIGGDRFDILFKRSLPLTKRGVFLVDILGRQGDGIVADTGVSLYFHNILTSGFTGNIGGNMDYENTVSDYILGDCDYTLSYFIQSETTNASYGTRDVIYSPLLDGSEDITSINQYTPTITDNELVTGCGYLAEGWSNIKDWELTFEYYTTGDNNGYTVIPKGTDQRDYNGIQQWYNNQLNFYVEGAKPSGNITNATVRDEWVNVRITKVGYIWTVYYNGVKKTEWDLSSYSSIVDEWDTMCIGLDKNSGSNRAKIRNIVVKEMDYIPLDYDDSLVTTTITYNLSDNAEIVEEMDKRIYSNIQTHISHEFTTPPNTESVTINISSDTSATLTDIRLGRDKELTDEEMYNAS